MYITDIQAYHDIFKIAKQNISREIMINIVDSINIPLKQNSEYIYNTNISKISGKNKNPNIVNIDNIFKNVTDSNLRKYRKNAVEKALNLFRDKVVIIKDTNLQVEINKSGIKETYSKGLSKEKIQSANNIDEIISEGIYKYSTKDIDSTDGILYHNFFTPIRYDNENNIMKIIIKEYTQNKTAKDKFYYHSLEIINNINNKGNNSILPR